MLREAWTVIDVFLVALALLALFLVVRALIRNGRIAVTVYDWEHALLYVNGRFFRRAAT